MSDVTEQVVSTEPFIVRRQVRWADCDPAALVYTGRYSAYLLDAVMLFYRHIGWAPSGAYGSSKVGLPCKHIALTFHRSLAPDDVIDIHIDVTAIREHSFDIDARGYFADGALTFEGVMSPICTTPGKHTRTLIPAELRQALQPHRRHISGEPV